MINCMISMLFHAPPHLWSCHVLMLQRTDVNLSVSLFHAFPSLCWVQVSPIDILKWCGVLRTGQYLHTVRTALLVLPWLLIDIPHIYTSNTVANLGKEASKLNSAKYKKRLFWKSGWGLGGLSVCMYACVHAFLVFLFCVFVCVCIEALACMCLLLSEMGAAEYSWCLCSVGAER